MDAPWPVELVIHQQDPRLEIGFDDGRRFDLSASLLRAMTPSAAERGHRGDADHPLPKAFADVVLTDAQLVGAYAVRLVFSDGHDSGIYTWDALHRMGRNKDALIREHQASLAVPQGRRP
jgi:DUF971 family protein